MFSDLVVGYLFLGGCSAGLLVYACVADLMGERAARRSSGGRVGVSSRQDRAVLNRCLSLAACGMALGILCLIADLGRPDRIGALLLSPSFSAISIGAYALGLALACSAALGLVGALDLAVPSAVRRLVEGFGCVFGVVTAAYTGVLLAQMGSSVALWNAALAPLFFFSSLSVGCACFEVVGYVEGGGVAQASRASLWTAAVVAFLEAVSVAAWIGIAVATGASPLLAGFFGTEEGACLLLCFCVLGLAVPLVLEVLRAARSQVLTISLIAPVLTIAGAFCLRYCLVNVPIV